MTTAHAATGAVYWYMAMMFLARAASLHHNFLNQINFSLSVLTYARINIMQIILYTLRNESIFSKKKIHIQINYCEKTLKQNPDACGKK